MASRGLGTLTLDLVAKTGGFVAGMDKAERSSKKWRRQVERDLEKASSAIKIGAGVAVAALGAMVVQTANSAREIQNLSRLANSTPEQFQRLAYGARQFGIEQDKLSDILKDVNDRIGDFAATGGGPMADFFENIAPLVGVTADDFARLSGPEALQLYVKSLEDANLSQADMTFYMEAIASDATALIPLLKDNGREMRTLGDEAERVGAVLSDVEIGQLEEMRRSFDQLAGAAEGVRNQVAIAAIPAIQDMLDLLTDPGTIESAQVLGNAIVSSINAVISAVDGAIKVTQFLAEELAAMTAGAAADDVVRLEDELSTLQSMLESPTERVRFFGKDGFIEFYNEAEIRQMIAETEQKIADAQKQLADKARQRQGAGVSLVDPSSVGAPMRTPVSSSSPVMSSKERDEQSKLEEDLAKRLDTLRQSFETEKQVIQRAFKEREEEIRALEEAGLMSEIETQNLRLQNEQEMFTKLKEMRQQDLEDQRQLEAQRQMLILGGSEQLFGSLAEMTSQFAGKQNALYKTLFAFQKAAAIAQSIVAINTGIAQAAALPFPVNLGAMATVAGATAGLIGNIQAVTLTGMAHDGIDSVPQTGTWLLEKGERVMTSETSKKLDQKLEGGSGVVVNLYEDASKAGQVQQGQRDDGTTEVNVFVSDIMSNGPRAKAMQRAYGLRRQGT